MIPQLIYLIMTSVGVGLCLKFKGTEKDSNAITSLISIVLIQGLFYWGGFYDQPIKVPQIIMAVGVMMQMGLSVYNHGKRGINKGLTPTLVIATIGQGVVLYFGGFFKPLLDIIQ